ncbi:MAG: hypothetical protein AAFY64_08545 [Pseudomonadota bacterium]
MAQASALQQALSVWQTPALIHEVRDAPLAANIDAVLGIAARDEKAMSAAIRQTRQPAHTLNDAAIFFIEQVLLAPDADSFRVLGSTPTDPTPKIRRRMGLLLRVMHPDTRAVKRSDAEIDRTVFSSRITLAWEDLKTEDRRRAYMRRCKQAPKAPVTSSARPRQMTAMTANQPKRSTSGRQKRRARQHKSGFFKTLIRVLRGDV